jgi:hypothetical protein
VFPVYIGHSVEFSIFNQFNALPAVPPLACSSRWFACNEQEKNMKTDATHLDIAALVGPDDWACLAPDIRRRFSPDHAPAVYRGALTVRRSAIGRLYARIAAVVGRPLPLCAGDDIETEVRVFPDGAGGVVWERWLFRPGHPASCVRSTKAIGRNGRLEERTDRGLVMALEVFVHHGALVFQSRGYSIQIFGNLRLPIPALLGPGQCRVTHEGLSPKIFRFTLEMRHRLWGRTFYQRGMFLDPPDPSATPSAVFEASPQVARP